MTIAQSTTIQAYQLRRGGTPARMAILRMIAADSVNNRNESTRLQPGDWRGARGWTMCSYVAAYGAGLNQGFNSEGRARRAVWYSHGSEQFRNERDAGDILGGCMRGNAWYTDVHQDETAIGIVASLTHGRFIAGYRWTSNDERVYFGEVFTDETDAARMADDHARVFAESAREDSEQCEAAQRLESETDDALQRLRECLVLRHKACMTYVRDEISELLETIRSNRESLRTDYANYV